MKSSHPIGKVHTMNTYVTKSVRWSHEMVFTTTQGQSPVYSDMSIPLFTNIYLSVVAEESVVNEEYMLLHLPDLMEDVEVYGWRTVREYQATWLQLKEQGQATCRDASKKDKLWRLVVWSKPALAPSLQHSMGHPLIRPPPPIPGLQEQVW